MNSDCVLELKAPMKQTYKKNPFLVTVLLKFDPIFPKSGKLTVILFSFHANHAKIELLPKLMLERINLHEGN